MGCGASTPSQPTDEPTTSVAPPTTTTPDQPATTAPSEAVLSGSPAAMASPAWTYPEGPPSGEQRASPVPRVLVIIATLNEGTQENFEATMKANFEGQRAKEDSCLFASFFHSTTDQMQFVWIECFDSGGGQKAHGGTEWAKAFFAFREEYKFASWETRWAFAPEASSPLSEAITAAKTLLAGVEKLAIKPYDLGDMPANDPAIEPLVAA